MSRIRVVLVDDHAMLRDGLRNAINQQPEMQVVGEASTGLEALSIIQQASPQVVCLDLSLPGMSGIFVIEQLRQQSRVEIVVLTMHDDPAYLRSALAAGAAGYVLKASPMPVLFSAIRAVARGNRYIDERMTPHLLDRQGARRHLTSQPVNPTPPVEQLSGRECEVLNYLALGYTHQEIADKLNVSIKTVETYRARIREKTGLRTRADFVRYGRERQGEKTAENPGAEKEDESNQN